MVQREQTLFFFHDVSFLLLHDLPFLLPASSIFFGCQDTRYYMGLPVETSSPSLSRLKDIVTDYNAN